MHGRKKEGEKDKNMRIEHLRVNHLENPIGYDFPYLVFSWKVEDTTAACLDAVRIIVSESEDMSALIYDSGIVNGVQRCTWEVERVLKPRTRYFWKVFAKACQRQSGAAQSQAAQGGEAQNAELKTEETWSETAWFETAKMEEAWEAEWISVPEDRTRMPILYRDLWTESKPKKARMYLFGAGLYEAEIGGVKVGDEVLTPGYHSYDLLMEYQTYDITELIRKGHNRVSVLLGEGWYKGRFGFDDVYLNLYGDRKKCIAEIYLEYESGKIERICTDENWKAAAGNILENGIYDGERQDDTLMPEPLEVAVLQDDKSLLCARSNPPVRKTEAIRTAREERRNDGSLLLDFGESITGWVEFAGRPERGQQIRLQYGEVLQNGEFYRDNLRTAKAEFIYTSSGEEKTIRPHFTYYGFRYVRVEGLREGQTFDFTAYRIMSDIEISGSIETSDPKVNKLYQNTIRSQKCNFLDIPTDCPQRDERMGWTGDVNIFAPTACFHMDSSAFFRHYTRSLYREQRLMKGAVPFFAPRPKVPVRENTNPFYLDGGACVWGDVAAMLPWTLYRFYGDRHLLKEQYPMMKAWVDYIRMRSKENEVPDLWQNDRQLGDWLALDNGNIHNPIGKTDSAFLASACYYQSALTVAKAAQALELAESKEYFELAQRIQKAFYSFYFTPNGELTIEMTQTACAFLLALGLYPENAEENLKNGLERLIRENHGHLNTGFVGTPVLCPALSESGYDSLAYDLLLNEAYPGWLYEVNLGATTVWERWNSLEADGTISGTGMNSLNHYAYGSIAEWMYRYMCGLNPRMDEEVKMLIRPMPDKRFSYVKGAWESVFGTYVSNWSYDDEAGFRYELEIPFNANAKVIFPNGKSCLLECGTYCFDDNGDRI